MLTARNHVMLTGGAPDMVHLIPAGKFSGVDGRGPFSLKDAQAVITASMGAGKLPIDENHATDLAAQTGQPSPARAWIVAMEARADGIWGRVEWTQTGLQLMTEGAYRGISPVFEHKSDGTVTRILRAALTNTPNLTQLANLHQETRMDLARLRAALGLPEAADEAAIVAAAEATRTAVAAHAAQLAAIATAAGLDAALPADRLVTSLQAQRASTGDVARMAATITSLETAIAMMRQEQGKAAATVFIDGAIRAGKPIVALRDHYVARHMADPAAVEKEVGAMVSINAGGTVVLHAATGGTNDDGLTPVDTDVATKMGLDPKKFAAFKKSRPEATDGRAA